jgi:ribonuclease HI
MADPTEVIVHTDGASRGNPGPAAIGVVIQDSQGRVLLELGEALERTTNNVAEYTAVIRALERARELGARRVQCLMDSQLVVRQLNGSYKVKHPDMLPLYRRVLELIQAFDDVTFSHVPREMNAEADRLANAALDSRGAPELGEDPVGAVRNLAERIEAADWDGARSLLAEGFRYRRPAAGDSELDTDAFLRSLRDWSLRWRVDRASTSGALTLVEATFETGRGARGSSLLICETLGGLIRLIAEYRDRGD